MYSNAELIMEVMVRGENSLLECLGGTSGMFLNEKSIGAFRRIYYSERVGLWGCSRTKLLVI